MFFFFFSSRRRHTRLQGDWSSDVCSSDLISPKDCSCFRKTGEHQSVPSRQYFFIARRLNPLFPKLEELCTALSYQRCQFFGFDVTTFRDLVDRFADVENIPALKIAFVANIEIFAE